MSLLLSLRVWQKSHSCLASDTRGSPKDQQRWPLVAVVSMDCWPPPSDCSFLPLAVSPRGCSGNPRTQPGKTGYRGGKVTWGPVLLKLFYAFLILGRVLLRMVPGNLMDVQFKAHTIAPLTVSRQEIHGRTSVGGIRICGKGLPPPVRGPITSRAPTPNPLG